ncbi:MAG: hypothetical protein JXQ67_06695 [Campylobacterales bacterium]|nr:hypothetical protein [Campylobacterales bacterium]
MQEQLLQTNPQNNYQEDEIDLRELFTTILAGKKIIFLTIFLIVSFTFVYILKLPNSYQSTAVLIPAESENSNSLGGLGGLAAMAGVSLGGGNSMTPDVAFNSLLNNYEFMQTFIEKNAIYEYYTADDADKNYIFVFGFRTIYEIFTPDKNNLNKNEEIYKLINEIRQNFSISADKKTGLISVSYNDFDRNYAPKMVSMFLKDASEYLVNNNLENVNKKLHYFEKEMAKTQGFELRQSLSSIISKIVQEKVMMQSKQYYQCDLLTAPQEPYILDKTKPKRGLILVVSFITSLILGVFIVFALNFLRTQKEQA